MIPEMMHCNNCGAEFPIDSYRKYVECPYCGTKDDFFGFSYREINWEDSMYSAVKKWTDCPVCRSPNMYLGPEKKAWKCPDCGFIMPDRFLKKGVLWFCDCCETFMNVQKGFNTKSGHWKCSVCGYDNSVTKDNII